MARAKPPFNLRFGNGVRVLPTPRRARLISRRGGSSRLLAERPTGDILWLLHAILEIYLGRQPRFPLQ
jgi:hypothetical protein